MFAPPDSLSGCLHVVEGVMARLTDWPAEAGRDERKVRRCQAELRNTHTPQSPSQPCD